MVTFADCATRGVHPRDNCAARRLDNTANSNAFIPSGRLTINQPLSRVAGRLAIVHVCSHLRQRHMVLTVRTFASVSIALPLQNGHSVGRATVSGESLMLFLYTDHAGSFRDSPVFKSEQPSSVA